MDVPFVGRADVLALLDQALDRARTGVPQRVLVEGRAADQDDPLPALEQAVSAGLLTERVGDPLVRFPHPLIHAAVYHQLGPTRRTALRLRAAELAADDRTLTLRHRACAATGPDRALAADLAALGCRLSFERNWSNAAGHLSTAARLSPDRAGYEQFSLEAVGSAASGSWRPAGWRPASGGAPATRLCSRLRSWRWPAGWRPG